MGFLNKYVGWLIAAMAAVIGAMGLRYSGYVKGKQEAKRESLEQENKIIKKRVDANEDISRLSSSDVDKRLRDKWRR